MSGQTMLMIHYLHDTQKHFLDQVDIEGMGYDELLTAFKGFKTLRSHGMAVGFREQGWNIIEIFGDFRELQERWAREHDIPVDDNGWMHQIVMSQMNHYRPQAVFCDDVSRYPDEFLTNRPNYVQAFAAMQGFPMNFDRLVHADVVFTCTPSIQMAFRDCGINAELVYHAFDPTVLDGLPEKTETHGFVFSGHSGYGYDWHHRTRYELLKRLLGDSPLEAWLAERDITLFPEIEAPLKDLFPHKTRPSVYGMDMYKLMNKSKIILNIHADAAYGHSGNMRMFEATGVGACMLTEHSLNITELFEPNVEVVTYRSPEECREKALYLLEHDDVRRKIGRRARERVLNEHLAEHRTLQMHESILSHL